MVRKNKVKDLDKRMDALETMMKQQAGRTEYEITERAREALLAFHKDQLVSHATILLTLGLLVVAAVGAWAQLTWNWLIIPTIVTAVPVAAWQGFRLILYSRLAQHTMYAGLKRMSDKEKGPAWTADDAIYQETPMWDLRRRVDEFALEIPLKHRPKPRRYYRCVFFLACPRPRGRPGERLTFHIYFWFAPVMWILYFIWDRSILHAVIPFAVYLVAVGLYLAVVVIRKREQREASQKRTREKSKH